MNCLRKKRQNRKRSKEMLKAVKDEELQARHRYAPIRTDHQAGLAGADLRLSDQAIEKVQRYHVSVTKDILSTVPLPRGDQCSGSSRGCSNAECGY